MWRIAGSNSMSGYGGPGEHDQQKLGAGGLIVTYSLKVSRRCSTMYTRRTHEFASTPVISNRRSNLPLNAESCVSPAIKRHTERMIGTIIIRADDCRTLCTVDEKETG